MYELILAVNNVQAKCSVLLASSKYSMSVLPREMPLAGVYIFL
jgi:hypothetical protein